MENVVTELKTNVFDRINREVTEKSKFKDEMENNVNILSTRLKVSQHRLGNFKHSNTNTLHDTTKLEYYSERILRENSHMDMELIMLKKRIEEMKNEIFEKDRESKQLKYQIYRDESEVAFLQEENRRVGKQVVDLHSEKKNMMTAIVLMKKQNDLLKSKVIKEDGKSKEFIAEVSALLNRGKVIY
jgi:chromosome segregation ATPase